jgi:uncharacterized protein (TIGR03067 family)
MVRLLPLPCLTVLFLAAAPLPPVPEKKDDPERILGKWVVQSAREEGKDVADLQKAEFTFDKDGNLTLKLANTPEEVKLRYNLLPDKPQKVIELSPVPINANDKNTRQHDRDRGLYKIDGDTLTLCICDGPGPDPQAPKDFEVKARYVMLVVLQREKK